MNVCGSVDFDKKESTMDTATLAAPAATCGHDSPEGDPIACPECRRYGQWYDYKLQAWVTAGRIEPCQHPAHMRTGRPCCPQHYYAGLSPEDAHSAVADGHGYNPGPPA